MTQNRQYLFNYIKQVATGIFATAIGTIAAIAIIVVFLLPILLF